ncbi:DsbA family oxidoreductase [Flavobacterium agricola]|uniref:DsbA family oxidoreductase n=1 Tax=Flavobacterium agricola TaxID=2870839 RepID=A0ABY6M071_9FLAO|nr:DsbA family oxidoreductase [Flavobacterium agricola]UYW01916.1 DsbA family oxidoreductase [Flavobacterium agricola]
MIVEIWSDVMFPFCYIGKRNFESALQQFSDTDAIEVHWKSFQLDPNIPEVATESYQNYLVTRKGMPLQQVQDMLQNVTLSAKQAGLTYNFDDAVMVNSIKAHQFIQFAKALHKDDEAEEVLFHAFFTEGKNIADLQTLLTLGTAIGLDANALQQAIENQEFLPAVIEDINQARQIGVTGVPFFVFNNKYAVSGAQPASSFLEVLNKSFGEWKATNTTPNLIISKGSSCDVKGNCD